MLKRKPTYWVFVYVASFILVVFAVVPFLFTVLSSFKHDPEIFMGTFWPANPTLSNYIGVITDGMMMRFFLNSLYISFFSALTSTVVSIFGAYGFSRYKFPGRNMLLYSIMFTRVLPRVTLLLPFFVILSQLNLTNTLMGLILVYMIIGMPVSVWLMKGYIDAIPYEVEEAALIDGCGPLATLLRVVVPMVAPAIAAISMFTFMLSWNEFLFPRVLNTAPEIRPISVGLAFYIDDINVRWGMLMAASVLMSIPAMIVFSLAQKHIVHGLSEGAVKG